MTMTEDQQREFANLARPLIKWLNENCHPHTHIFIDQTTAEISEGVMSFTSVEYVKD